MSWINRRDVADPIGEATKASVCIMSALTPETLKLLQVVLDETWGFPEARGKVAN